MFLFVGGLLWWLMAPEVVTEEAKTESARPVVLSHIELKDFGEGKLKMTLFAVEAQLFEETEITELTDIKGIVEPEKLGGEPTRFRADRGKIKGKEKLVSLIGDIQVELPRGRKLVTQVLYYDQNKDLLYNDQPVRMFGVRDSVEAQGMEYQLDEGFLTLKNPILEAEL